MAILTGPEIQRQMALGNIKIDPAPKKFGPNSVDLHLGRLLKVYNLYGSRHTAGIDEDRDRIIYIDPQKDNPTIDIVIPPEGFVLRPGVLYLAATEEYTETHGFVPYLDGRSSIGRIGIAIHQTAGRGDTGFCGRWTCEMTAVHLVRIYAGMRFAQITYHTVYGEIDNYRGVYQGDKEPVASRLHMPGQL